MRNLLLTLAVTVSASAALAASPTKTASNRLAGDYVEARTASVFAGACHFNGELTTEGRDAEMVWHVREGAWDGTSLAGLNAVAAITAEANLRNENAERHAVLYIDAKATSAQAKALTAALQASYGRSLGKITAVKRVSIAFARSGETYRIEAKGVGKLDVDAMPNHACCKQPNLVWYKPLVELSTPRVGFTRVSGIQDKTQDISWTKNGQNTAFYGSFAAQP